MDRAILSRSRIMAAVPRKNSKPELIVRAFLYQIGFRYRLHVKALPGTPDIVLPKYRTVIFVHGCFWHGHQGCKAAHLPNTNTEFWRAKQEANRIRDQRVQSELEQLGWRIEVVWQCEIKNNKSQDLRLWRLSNTLKN